jgi:hypothetical protein
MWNIAKSMIHLNLYLFVLVQMTHLLLNEKVYSIYGDKSSKFRFKWAKESQEAPEIPSVNSAESQSTNFDPSAFLESIKSFVTSPANIAKLKIAIRNTGIATGVGVLGLGGYSLNEYREYVEHEGKSTEGAVPGDMCNIRNLEKLYECDQVAPPKGFIKEEYVTEGTKFTATIFGTKDGVEKEFKLEIQKVKNSVDKYIDKNGMELILFHNSMLGRYEQAGKNIYSNQENILKIKPIQSKGARIIACPSSNVDRAIRENHLHGLETIAIIGTGTTFATSNKLKDKIKAQKLINPNYQFTFSQPDKQGNISSPAGEILVRFPDKNREAKYETNYEKFLAGNDLNYTPLRDAGIVTYMDGTTKMLDFLDESQTNQKLKNQIVFDGLKNLRNDKNVQSFSVTGWAAREKYSKFAQNLTPQTRLVYAFDKGTKELLGAMATPRIRFNQIPLFVQHSFGKNAVGVNMDGDLFTGIDELREPKIEMVGGNIPTRNTNMYFTNAAMCMVVAKQNPALNLMPKDMQDLAWNKFKNDKVKDKLADPWKQFFGWWYQLIGQK